MFKPNFKFILKLILIPIIAAIPLKTDAQFKSQRLSQVPAITIEFPDDLSPNLSRRTPTESATIGDHKGVIDSLMITAYDIESFGNTQESTSENALIVQNDTITTSNDPLKMEGSLLNFPNPFRLTDSIREGTHSYSTMIRYQLNQDAATEIRIYDQFANEILRQSYAFGENGGMGNANNFTNSILLKKADFNTPNVPAGIYFYLLLNEGKILGKGKMAIVP
jgi:hypothetical protein